MRRVVPKKEKARIAPRSLQLRTKDESKAHGIVERLEGIRGY